MLKNRLLNLTAVVALGFSQMAVSAPIVLTHGNIFDDLGTSTIDLQANIEWLDLTETNGRSFIDVNQDIQDDTTGTFNISDGWRYATQQDFATLITNWFGFSYAGGFTSASGDNPLTELFINTFGDTLDAEYDASGNFRDASPDGAATSWGFLAESSGQLFDDHVTAFVADQELIFRANGSSAGDADDEILDFRPFTSAAERLDLGSWLIRDFTPSQSQISEPGYLWLSLILTAFFFTRRANKKTL